MDTKDHKSIFNTGDDIKKMVKGIVVNNKIVREIGSIFWDLRILQKVVVDGSVPLFMVRVVLHNNRDEIKEKENKIVHLEAISHQDDNHDAV